MALACAFILERLPQPRTRDRHVESLLMYLSHVPRLQQVFQAERQLAANVQLELHAFYQLRLTALYLEQLETRLTAPRVGDDEVCEQLGRVWNELADAETHLTRTLERTHALMPSAFDDCRWRFGGLRPRTAEVARLIGGYVEDFTARLLAEPAEPASSDVQR